VDEMDGIDSMLHSVKAQVDDVRTAIDRSHLEEVQETLLTWVRGHLPEESSIPFIAMDSVFTVKHYTGGTVALWTWDEVEVSGKSPIEGGGTALFPRVVNELETIVAVLIELRVTTRSSALEFLEDEEVELFLL